MMNASMIRELVGNKFFSVIFTKKNGEMRKMTARLGVKKHLKGGQMKHNPDELNHLVVFDMAKKEYRTINIDTLIELKFKGKMITIK